jgi:hypothetical protein
MAARGNRVCFDAFVEDSRLHQQQQQQQKQQHQQQQ